MSRLTAAGRVLGAFVVAGLLGVPRAAAATLNWIDPLGGSAGTASNWNPAQAPTTLDTLVFNLNASYPVTFSSTAATSRAHQYRLGTVTLNVTSPHDLLLGLTFGTTAGDNATAILSAGKMTLGSNLVIGSAASTTGRFRLTSRTSRVDLTAVGTDVFLGQSGNGTLELTAGGVITVPDDVLVGNLNGSVGTATLSGYTFESFQFYRSSIVAGGDILVGSGSGTGSGTVSVSDFAILSAGAEMIIGGTSTATGTVTVSDGGGNIGTIGVGTDLYIGSNTNASLGAGTGTLNVNDGGFVTVAGTTRISDINGGSGTLQVSTGGSFSTGSLLYIDGGGQGLNFSGGTIELTGGTFDPPGPAGTPLTLTGAGTPTLVLDNNSSMTVSRTTPGTAFTLGGASGPATLELHNGSQCNITGGSSDVSIGPSGAGTLTVDSNAIFDADRNFNIGSVGTVNVSGGGSLQGFNASVAATRTLSVTGAGSDFALGGTLTNSGTTLLGTGATGQAANVTNTGALNVTGGSALTANNAITHSGTITLDGSIGATTLDFNGSGSLSGKGSVAANILMDSTTASITASGDALTLGNAASNSGFLSTGMLNVGAQTVNVNDLDTATIGGVTIAGGTLNVPNGSVLSAGKTLSGNGLVNGAVTNSGTIAPSSTGLSFAGLVTGTGQGIAGTLVRFLSTGDFSGAGTINADVDIDAGASVTTVGNLTMGKAADSAGFNSDGTIAVANHAVTLLDADTAPIGDVTISGGTLVLPPAGGVLAAGRSLTGGGTINGPLANSGAIAPSGTGLSFGGMLSGIGQGIAGTRMTFLNGGGYTGAGIIDAELDGRAGSTITATGDLTVGRAASSTGVTLGGILDVGDGESVTLLDADGIDLGGLTVIAVDALISATVPLTVPAGGVLRGRGNVATPTFALRGTYEAVNTLPGFFSLVVAGNYVQYPGSELRLDINGNQGAPDPEQVLVQLNATIGGAITIGFGFAPLAGQTFTLLSADVITGAFDTITPVGLPVGLGMELYEEPYFGGERLKVSVILDADGDGAADTIDCAPADPGAKAVPTEIKGLLFSLDAQTLDWTSIAPLAGSGSVHDVVRGVIGEWPMGGGPSDFCLGYGLTDATTTDTSIPSLGQGYWYEVRGRNSCAAGTYGSQTNGTERAIAVCP